MSNDTKPAKTPKTTTKLKLSTPKTPAADSSTKKAAAKPKSAKAAKAAKSASDEEAVTPKVEEKPLTPQQAKEVKEKKGEGCSHGCRDFINFSSVILSTQTTARVPFP